MIKQIDTEILNKYASTFKDSCAWDIIQAFDDAHNKVDCNHPLLTATHDRIDDRFNEDAFLLWQLDYLKNIKNS